MSVNPWLWVIFGWCVAGPTYGATANEDVFASSGAASANQCGTAYMACQAENHLNASTNARY